MSVSVPLNIDDTRLVVNSDAARVHKVLVAILQVAHFSVHLERDLSERYTETVKYIQAHAAQLMQGV